jgi:DNA invertase Pin-like site-specific DNA recombinase
MKEAIALYRVSTHRQSIEGHSLDAQEARVKEAAKVLEVKIVKEWRIDSSSKVGVNLSRKDLKEAIQFCKQNKNVRYFIIDEVDRFMRSIKEYYWYQVEFDELGVELRFASQPELSEKDQFAKLREMLAIYEAESSNAERSRKTLDKMKARVRDGYYPFYPHQGYRNTENRDGLHVPDSGRYELLQKALKYVANFEMSPKEAQIWLKNAGYRTRFGGRILDMGRWHEILMDPYFAGIIRIESWDIEVIGLHKAMITVHEHETNVSIISARKIRHKRKNNPNFPLNLAFHEPCKDVKGKLTGINHTNGRGWSRLEYVCRVCKKRIPQQEVHKSLSQLLENMNLSVVGNKKLKEAITTVWSKKEGHRIKLISQLENQKSILISKKGDLISTLSANPDLSEDIKTEINKVKDDITDIEQHILDNSQVDSEFTEFIRFSFDYTEQLRTNWWNLSIEKQIECKDLLFQNEIIVSAAGKVYTPRISPIYTLESTKKAPEYASDAHMVELVGTAPTSDW